MKNKKDIRFQLLLTEQLDNDLDYFSKYMNKNKSEIIRTAIFNYCQGNENILYCPTCQVPLVDRQEVPLNGISEISCNSGHTHWYDWDDYKWVK